MFTNHFNNRRRKQRQLLLTVCSVMQTESSGLCIKTGERFSNHPEYTQRFGFYHSSYIINLIRRRVHIADLDLLAIFNCFFFSPQNRQSRHCTQLLDKLYVERTARRAKTYKTCPLWKQPMPLLQIKVGATNLLRQPLSFSHSLLCETEFYSRPLICQW